MENTDIRWVQRYSNFRKALAKMSEAIDIVAENYDWQDSIDELLKEGLIQRLEYTHELAWKVMKDYVEYQGVAGRYYKSYVGIWGGPDDTGDARYIWTSSERAT